MAFVLVCQKIARPAFSVARFGDIRYYQDFS
jgi:hypothetical protein